jgi:hypothetical protein
MEFLMSIISRLQGMSPKDISEIKCLEVEKIAWTDAKERQYISFKTHDDYEFSIRVYIPKDPSKESA